MNDRSPWAAPTPPTRSLAWPAPKPIQPTAIAGNGYPVGYLERLKEHGFRVPGEPERPFVPEKRPARRPAAKKRIAKRKRKWSLLDIKGAKRRVKRKLKGTWTRKAIAFGSSVILFDITKLSGNGGPVRSPGNGHSRKCNAGRKGAKGGPGFIRADPNCPACRKAKKGKGKR